MTRDGEHAMTKITETSEPNAIKRELAVRASLASLGPMLDLDDDQLEGARKAIEAAMDQYAASLAEHNVPGVATYAGDTYVTTDEAYNCCHPDRPNLWEQPALDRLGREVRVAFEFSEEEAEKAGEDDDALPWDDDHIEGVEWY